MSATTTTMTGAISDIDQALQDLASPCATYRTALATARQTAMAVAGGVGLAAVSAMDNKLDLVSEQRLARYVNARLRQLGLTWLIDSLGADLTHRGAEWVTNFNAEIERIVP